MLSIALRYGVGRFLALAGYERVELVHSGNRPRDIGDGGAKLARHVRALPVGRRYRDIDRGRAVGPSSSALLAPSILSITD